MTHSDYQHQRCGYVGERTKKYDIYPFEGCFSDVRVPIRTKNPRYESVNLFFCWGGGVRELFTLLGLVWNLLEHMFKRMFKPCFHIELNTQNPNTIFQISIYCTNYTQNAKILSRRRKVNRLFTSPNRHAQTFPDTQSNP